MVMAGPCHNEPHPWQILLLPACPLGVTSATHLFSAASAGTPPLQCPAVPPYWACCPSAAARVPRGGSVLGAPAPAPPGMLALGEELEWPGGQLAGGLSRQIAGPSSQRDVILSRPQPRGVEFHPLVYSRPRGRQGPARPREAERQGAPSWTPVPGGSRMGTRPASTAPAQPAAPGPSQLHPLQTPPSRPGPLPAGTRSCQYSRPHAYRVVGDLLSR